jgi:hypothetical protein
MIIVKIDRDTIKKNPNAGNTRTYLQGQKEASFKIESDNIPEWLYKEPFFSTQWSEEELEGTINGPITDEMIEKIKTVKGLSINIKCEPIVIDHFPEPDYFYNYEQTTIKCNHCKNKIDVDEIEEDWEDDYCMQVCPVCEYFNTFPEYKYEKIEDVIKKPKK